MVHTLGGKDRQISLSSKPAWSTSQVPGQQGLHNKIMSQKTKQTVYMYP